MTDSATDQVRAELAPQGVLRAGINMSNPLLVTGRTQAGEPDGVAPDLARAIAARLGVPVQLVPFPSPSQVADAAGTDAWDICLIGAEPQRAERITFTPAYTEIEATYLVPAGSPITAIDQVDRPGLRIAAARGSAYGLWLERNIRHAEMRWAGKLAEAVALFTADGLDALAGLRTALTADSARLPGTRVLAGQFMAVQQAVGTGRGNAAGAEYLRGFVRDAKRSGLVAGLIAKHGAAGLTVPN